MTQDIVTDYGVNKNWKAFKNGDNPLTFDFNDSAGAAFDISSYTFTLNIKKLGGELVLALTQGSGLTNNGATGILDVLLTKEQSSTTLPGDTYFWELVYVQGTVTNRMFQGILTLSKELNPGSATTSISATLSLSSTIVNVSVTVGGGGSGGASTAEDVSFTPAGGVEATNVQGALEEVASDVGTVSSAVTALDTAKQDALISGSNIKTVNGNSLLGSGDVTIEGGGGGTWGSIAGTLSNQTDLQGELDDKSDVAPAVNEQIDDYTLVLTDINRRIDMNKATAVNLTVPANSTVAFPVDTVLLINRIGAGQLTFVADTGVTIESSSGLLTDPGQYCLMALVKKSTNLWYLFNGLPGTASIITDVVIAANMASLTLTNQPNSERFLANSAYAAAKFDATNYREVRLDAFVAAASASANSPRIYIQYSLDRSSWITIGAGTVASGDACSLSAVAGVTSNWITIPAPAKADVWFRVADNGGDTAADPALSSVRMQFRT